jgi:hypothetical protein
LITKTDTDELRALQAGHSAVISLYLNIPVDIAEHRGLVTRARELVKDAGGSSTSDADTVAGLVTRGSLDWLGQTVAIFACGELGLAQAIPMPGHWPDRAMIAPRPYLRPMLAVLQRNPDYQVAVLDAKQAWVLAIGDDGIATLAERTGREVPSSGFAGWDGLEAYRIQQRIMQLAKQHYRDTIEVLEQTGDGLRRPLVLGGHEMQLSQFRSVLPLPVRQRLAGTFSLDLQSATPAKVRELAAPVIADWAEASEAQLVNDVLSEPPGTSVATSLDGAIAAVRARAASNVVVPDDQVVPGYACADCGSLGVGQTACDCQDPAQSCEPIPDVLDYLTSQALDGGSAVTAVRQAPFTAAARLRFPLP